MSDEFSIHPAAKDELHEIIRHYAAIDDLDNEESQPLAAAFVHTFYRWVDEIVANPLLSSQRHPPTRRVNLKPRFGS